jgi:hypothetical protein
MSCLADWGTSDCYCSANPARSAYDWGFRFRSLLDDETKPHRACLGGFGLLRDARFVWERHLTKTDAHRDKLVDACFFVNPSSDSATLK